MVFEWSTVFEIINFYYPEQEDFGFKQLSMYDAEGLISISDYLLIFTKNRAKKTKSPSWGWDVYDKILWVETIISV